MHCLAFMQATLLYEIFRRFRGRKTTVQCSRHFEELYRRLRERSLTGMDSFSCVDMDVDEPNHKSIDSPSEWRRWIDIEARHRLLLACFIFDEFTMSRVVVFQNSTLEKRLFDSLVQKSSGNAVTKRSGKQLGKLILPIRLKSWVSITLRRPYYHRLLYPSGFIFATMPPTFPLVKCSLKITSSRMELIQH
ncbi:hypothetical protein DH86_00001597 [Scytalidium sp. 3C]|nr:hypothetical protein DH86_00001597 [Scytalidium sp. 3C]